MAIGIGISIDIFPPRLAGSGGGGGNNYVEDGYVEANYVD